ncbi:MAG TPA: hypothetical protein VHP33_30050 [Polyangiaceae bacterium]|nr:hypothetical protein [Polyangiaceae bacterium]
MNKVLEAALPRRLWALATLTVGVGAGCAADTPATGPQSWTGFFHPAPLPGHSINNGKQCECRACDPSSCCGAEQTESSGASPPECNSSNSYEFSDKCGITVQTCTPRCYPHVWRVGKLESCSASRPLVCCE